MAYAKGLWKNTFEDFKFFISLCIWDKMLDKVNCVSKVLKQEEMDIEDAITKIKEIILYLKILDKMVLKTWWRKPKSMHMKFVLIWYFPKKKKKE